MHSLKNISWSPEKYHEAAVVAHEVGIELQSRLDLMKLNPSVILDLGCGTGELSITLKNRYPTATIISVDHSEAMLTYFKSKISLSNTQSKHCLESLICGNTLKLPIKDQTVDLIVANFLLPWVTNIDNYFRECYRVLKPHALLLLTALGPDTLSELHSIINKENMPTLLDMHDLGDLLVEKGFIEPVLDIEYFTVNYRDKNKLTSELNNTGMLFNTNEIHVDDQQALRVTYEIIYAHAFKADHIKTFTNLDGETAFPLASLRQQLKTYPK